jgi:hypothetical protein
VHDLSRFTSGRSFLGEPPANGRAVPDHSMTFSKNRHGRFRESDLFRQLFEQAVEPDAAGSCL